MKSNIVKGIVLISALALGSCSTAKLASNQDKEDDVYYSQAKAGDQPEYRPATEQQNYNNNNDDDYYYYGSYASRINRFGYFSPFSYYDDLNYGYSPYAYNDGYSAYGYGIGIGFGYGYGGYGGYYGYSPYSYGLGFGYGYGAYSGYSYYGTGYGYGYGGGGYWGTVSAYSSVNRARPSRGTGSPGNGTLVNRSIGAIGYNGSYPTNGYPGRPVVSSNNGGRQAVNSTGYTNNNNNGSRPTRQAAQPVYQQPQTQQSYSPPPASTSSSSGSSSSNSSGGGGGRPVRP